MDIKFFLPARYNPETKQFEPEMYTNLAQNVLLDIESEETVAGAITELQDKSAAAVPMTHTSSDTTYGIATASLYGHAMASSATPLVAGTADIGTDNGKFAREGHVHPAQTSVTGSSGSCTGNAATATKLATARTINGVSFDGSGNITIADSTKAPTAHASTGTTYGAASDTNYGHVLLSNATPSAPGTAAIGSSTRAARQNHVHPLQTSVSGNSGTATQLATARTFRTNLASTSTASFDGSANVTPGVTGILPVANGGTGNSSGNSPTASKWTTARTLSLTGAVTGSVSIDGSGNVSLATSASGSTLGFTQSLAANGWTKLPNGLILQWGSSTGESTNNTTVNFPIAFPNACTSISGVWLVESNWAICVKSISKANFVWFRPTGNSGMPIKWLAIGY